MNELRGMGRGIPFSQTATAAGNATATQTPAANQTCYITDISGSSDLAGATIQVKSGSTVIWQDRVSNTAAYVKNFTMPIVCAAGAALTVVVTGTAYGAANVAGYMLQTP